MRARVGTNRNSKAVRTLTIGALAMSGSLAAVLPTGQTASAAATRLTAPALTDADLAPHRPGVILVRYASDATDTW